MADENTYLHDLDEDPAPSYQPAPEPSDLGADPWITLNNGLTYLTSRLDDSESATKNAVTAIFESLAELQTQVALLMAREVERKQPPASWAARATPEDWSKLANWVDWINETYSIKADFEIFPCWPTHGGVVEELAGCWRSWQAAVISDAAAKKNGSAELTAWHDRWLWPMLGRLNLGHYRITNCKAQHRDEILAYRPTDRGLIPATAGPSE